MFKLQEKSIRMTEHNLEDFRIFRLMNKPYLYLECVFKND